MTEFDKQLLNELYKNGFSIIGRSNKGELYISKENERSVYLNGLNNTLVDIGNGVSLFIAAII